MTAAELEKEAEEQKKSKNGEQIAALGKAVQGMLNFVEEGGEVDFVIPNEDSEIDEPVSEENQKLRTTFEEIRKIETHIMLLEDKREGDA